MCHDLQFSEFQDIKNISKPYLRTTGWEFMPFEKFSRDAIRRVQLGMNLEQRCLDWRYSQEQFLILSGKKKEKVWP